LRARVTLLHLVEQHPPGEVHRSAFDQRIRSGRLSG
jgi:hypothetical protein